MMEGITLRDYERAEVDIRAVEGRRRFYIHAAVYVLVNILLLVLNLVFVPGFLWFFFPLIGWGIGLTMHYIFGVQFVGKETRDWQSKVEHRAREIHA